MYNGNPRLVHIKHLQYFSCAYIAPSFAKNLELFLDYHIKLNYKIMAVEYEEQALGGVGVGVGVVERLLSLRFKSI